MAKREPVRIPLDFEKALSELMKIRPPDKSSERGSKQKRVKRHKAPKR